MKNYSDLQVWVRDGQSCSHNLCKNHVKTRCEGCGRKGAWGTIYFDMSDIGEVLSRIWDFNDLPNSIKEKSIEFLKENIEEETKQKIQEEYQRKPNFWWCLLHNFGIGLWVRNGLRKNVCLNDDLPSGNWDDYYVELIEIACGIKS